MKIQYINWKPKAATVDTLVDANEIIEDYMSRGYTLTLRQLYYQLVAKDIIPNKQKAYDRLGTIMRKARDAGLVDWDAIVDRTRGRKGLRTWEDPVDAITQIIEDFRIDKWDPQLYRLFVWVEKEALSGVISRACSNEDIQVDYISCRGYMSASTIHDEAKNLYQTTRLLSQQPVILHLADHDPSGMDMSRDNIERLAQYSGLRWDWDEAYSYESMKHFRYHRIALNMDQVEEYQPPPNPAKLSDSRAGQYTIDYGYDSWELDALDPDVLVELIQEWILKYRDQDLWQEQLDQEAEYLEELKDML